MLNVTEFDNLTDALEEAEFEAENNGVKWSVCVSVLGGSFLTLSDQFAIKYRLTKLEVIRPKKQFSSGYGKWIKLKHFEKKLEKAYRKNPLNGLAIQKY